MTAATRAPVAANARSVVELAAVAAGALLLLAPALWNGFPFTFFDSGAFIEQSFDSDFRPERSVFYTWFLDATLFRASLWLTVAAQALLTAAVLRQCARVVAPGLGPGGFLAIVLVLGVATGLPWYVGQVEPDVFGPLMVLALYLLGFHGQALSRPQRWGLGAVAVLAGTSHASHLALAIGLAIFTGLVRLLASKDAGTQPRPGPAMLVAAISFCLVVASNYARTGDVFFSRAGAAFLLARLVEDGIVKRLLDDTCPPSGQSESGYFLCPDKDRLPRTTDDYLWSADTPFWKHGGFDGTAAQSSLMIADSLRRYPLQHLRAAADATARQLARLRTGDGLVPQPWPVRMIIGKFLPGQLAAFDAARQQSAPIDFTWVNRLHVPVAGAAVLASIVLFALAAWRGRWEQARLPGFLLVALLGNAFIGGALSAPHDRYQSRLIWTLVFALLLALAATRRRTRPD